jgi:hypothetical protein
VRERGRGRKKEEEGRRAWRWRAREVRTSGIITGRGLRSGRGFIGAIGFASPPRADVTFTVGLGLGIESDELLLTRGDGFVRGRQTAIGGANDWEGATKCAGACGCTGGGATRVGVRDDLPSPSVGRLTSEDLAEFSRGDRYRRRRVDRRRQRPEGREVDWERLGDSWWATEGLRQRSMKCSCHRWNLGYRESCSPLRGRTPECSLWRRVK